MAGLPAVSVAVSVRVRSPSGIVLVSTAKSDPDCVGHGAGLVKSQGLLSSRPAPATAKDCLEMPPIPIKSAKGLKLFEAEGNFYYDTISSWWCNVHGHGHPHIIDAIKRQLDELEHVLFAGFTHGPAIELSEKLTKLLPEQLTKVFYSDNGSTSVEVALKMSIQYWKNKGYNDKTNFISKST